MPPDRELARAAFRKLAEELRSTGKWEKGIEELAEGFVDVANELMAKSARKLLTFGKPDALVVFGSAGGQHCCDVA